MKEITVLKVAPMCCPEVVTLKNDLRSLQEAVSIGADYTGLMEIVELPDHPWFLGCQFHPVFKSRPMAAHPLFREFIKAAKNNHKK